MPRINTRIQDIAGGVMLQFVGPAAGGFMSSSVVQTVSVNGPISLTVGWLDYVSLCASIVVGIGTVYVATSALIASRRFRDWQKVRSEPFPVVCELLVHRVVSTRVSTGEHVSNGFTATASVFNAGDAPLLVRISKLNFNFGPDGKAGYSAFNRYGASPVMVRGGGAEKITFVKERPVDWDHPEWPDSISLLMVYVAGRENEGFFETWNLTPIIGLGDPDVIRYADVDRMTEFDIDTS